MAYKLMIQGTMSSAGKSFIVTALCRLFSDLGFKVAPFKSQNMALNSGVTFDGFEMGRAQIVQAEAARTVPDVRMNPILLKPNSDVGSQVIVMGKPIGNMKAREYYDYKTSLVPVIKEAFYSLEKEYDVIIVEGAGSPAEINLKDNDIVNMGLAKMLDIPVLLVGDIDLGGVFAQLLGTLEWLEEDERDRIKGLIINKFRGDVSLLKPGIDMLTERTKKDVVGVVPYAKVSIDEEDSVTIDLDKNDNKNQSESILNVCVIRLPHLSNFTDFTPLKNVKGVSVNYVDNLEKIKNAKPDLIIIPGTKSTIADMNWLSETGLSRYIIDASKSVPIIGICGGYQMLGVSISDPYNIESCDSKNNHYNPDDISNKLVDGLSLLSHSTVISSDKTLKKTEGIINNVDGFFQCLNGCKYEGYEIHCGVSSDGIYDDNNLIEDLIMDSNNNVFGTYIHGFFDRADVTKSLLKALADRKYKDLKERKDTDDFGARYELFVSKLDDITDYSDIKEKQYNLAAKMLQEALNIKRVFEIMNIPFKG